MTQERSITPSHRELARKNFVYIGEYLEATLDITLAGQSPKLTSVQLAKYTAKLQEVAEKLTVGADFLRRLAHEDSKQFE